LQPSLLRPRVPASLAVAIACLSSFMVVMDSTIVNVALPSIGTDLGLPAASLHWVVDAYLLMLGGFMLLAARAGDLFGRRPILQAGLFVFTAASLVGGLAPNGAMLLIARAVQGLGASVLATSTLALIVAVCPGSAERRRAISIWAASSSIASAVGVGIGGLLTTLAGWRWVMFVNVPIGAVLAAMIAVCLSRSPARQDRQPLDVPGALSITLGMGLLMYGISQSATQGWSAPTVLTAWSAAAMLLLAFVRIEATGKHPLVRLDIFRLHNVRMGNIVVLGLGACLTASTFLTSLLLQQTLGYGALDTGLALLPMGLALAVSAMTSRALMDRGVRQLPFVGGLLCAAGLMWMSAAPDQAIYAADVLGPTLCIGTGLGLMLMTATHTALDGVPPQDAGLASGLFNTARQLGAALGVSALSSLTEWQGHHAAFIATATFAVLSAIASLSLRPGAHTLAQHKA